MADVIGKKISELAETTDLAGLYTIGSDKNNQSKKVSLQFVKEAADYANAQGDYAKGVGDTVQGNTGVDEYPVFSASTQYAAGSVVRYNDRLYRFTSLHPAGAWVGTDAVETSIKAETDVKLTELESEVANLEKDVEEVADSISNIKPIVINGDVVNAPDEEDITMGVNNLLTLKNRNSLNGMGYVILRKSKNLLNQITESNTIYEVRYDFDLSGATLTIPDNCCIKFNGGSFKNGSVFLSETKIEGVGHFDCVVKGRIQDNVIVDFFGVRPANSGYQNSANIENIQVENLDLIFNGEYEFASPLIIHNNNIVGLTKSKLYFPQSDGLVTAIDAARVGKKIANIHIQSQGHCLMLNQEGAMRDNHYVSCLFSNLTFESETTSAVFAELPKYAGATNYGYNCKWENLLFIGGTHMFENVQFILCEELSNITDYSKNNGAIATSGSAFHNCRFLHCTIENLNICNGRNMKHVIYNDAIDGANAHKVQLVEFRHCNFESLRSNLVVSTQAQTFKLIFTDCTYAYTFAMTGKSVYCVDKSNGYALVEKTLTDDDVFYPIVGRYLFVQWRDSYYSMYVNHTSAENNVLFCVRWENTDQYANFKLATNGKYGEIYFDAHKHWEKRIFGVLPVQKKRSGTTLNFNTNMDNTEWDGVNTFKRLETSIDVIDNGKYQYKWIDVIDKVTGISSAIEGTFFRVAKSASGLYDQFVNISGSDYHVYLCNADYVTIIPSGKSYAYVLRTGDKLHVCGTPNGRIYSVERAFVNTLQAHYDNVADAQTEMQWSQTDADGSMSVIGDRLAIVTGGKLSNPNGSTFSNLSMSHSELINRKKKVVGDIFFDSTHNRMVIWDGTQYVHVQSYPIGVRIAGTYNQAPEGVDGGFAYYCTDRTAIGGEYPGIMIYWNEDEMIWCDALGREIS